MHARCTLRLEHRASIRVNFARMSRHSRSASDSHHFERAYLSFIRVTKVINDLPHLYMIVHAGEKYVEKYATSGTPAADTFLVCNLESVITCRALHTLASYSRRVSALKCRKRL